MRKLLHIIATPRGDESRTLKVTTAFLKTFKQNHPDCEIDELNVAVSKLPPLTKQRVDGKYVLLGGGKLAGELLGAWKEILEHINRFLSADAYLISTPMWNFSVPYPLKHYIDIIVQPGYLFRYTEKGPEGLIKNKKMVIITTRGGDYSPESPFRPYDHQENYLRTIFNFAGITDITFINAQPMDMGPELQAKKIEEAKRAAKKIAGEL